MLKRIGSAVIVAAALATAPAEAAFFSVTFTAQSGDAGNLNAAFDVNAGTVVGITGTTSLWGDITGLLALDTYLGNDNRLPITTRGISFRTASSYLNLFDGRILAVGPAGTGDVTSVSPGNLTIQECRAGSLAACVPGATAVPEPASMALLGAGLLGLGVAMRRRRAA